MARKTKRRQARRYAAWFLAFVVLIGLTTVYIGWPELQQMFDDARAQGVYPIVASGYRTAKRQHEPWHYRYVGKEAAAEIHRQGVCLEEYLGAR